MALVFALFFLGKWMSHFFTSSSTKPRPPKVVVQKPVMENLTDYVMQTGTTIAFQSVNLVARVEGYLDKVNFTDGSFVQKNKELLVIEPKPYLEKLNAEKAMVIADESAYAYAKTEYARQQRMYKQNATSLNNVEKWRAKTEEYKAEISKAKANEEIAKINYSYTHILAPFDGRIGRHLVDVGNLVGHGEATKLAVIEQISPIYVYFNLNELDLIKIRKAAKAQGMKPSDINTVEVEVEMQSESGFPHKGTLDFVNTGLNASTGTMEFRAVLPNEDLVLLPGLFVRVRIPTSKPIPKLTVPESALQYDQVGAYLLTVDKNNVVEVKRVDTGASNKGKKAILKGLNKETQVVVEGIQKAIPGNKVTPVNLQETAKKNTK